MSQHPSVVTLTAVVTTGMVLFAAILMAPATAFGSEQWETSVTREGSAATAPAAALPETPGISILSQTEISVPSARYQLDEKDEIAALERIQYALTEVGDGKTYVWRRWHGKLSGLVQPTASFKDSSGKICRHLIVLMTNGPTSKRQEGIACRLPSGRWQLDG